MAAAAQQTRDSAVSLTRISAMLLIMICHTSGTSHIGMYIGTLTTVGISVFLMISGYLYGKRDVRPLPFLKKRYMSITFPAVVFVLAMAVYYWRHDPNPNILPTVLLFVCNLQGANKIYSRIPSVTMGPGVLHLWFLTALMLCYLLMLAVKKVEKKHPVSRRACYVLLAVSTVVVFAGGMMPYHIRFNLIQIFFIGYWYAQHNTGMNGKRFLLCSAATALGAIPVLLLLQYFPDSNWYVAFGYLWRNLLGIWIFFFYLYLRSEWPDKIDRLASTRFVRHLDVLCYYLYIVHYIFSEGPFRVFDLSLPRPVQLLAFAALTTVCAEILMALCKPVIRLATRPRPTKET